MPGSAWGSGRRTRPIRTTGTSSWTRTSRGSSTARARCCRAWWSGGRGHIVTIGSPAARYPFPGANVYAGTKAFVRQLSSNLRADLHGTDIRITLIEPGRTRTEVFDVRFGGDKARAAEMFEDAVPMEPEDVAEAVHWVTTMPARVNIDRVEMMPVAQTFAPLPVLKRKGA